jgi:hypothetical protein
LSYKASGKPRVITNKIRRATSDRIGSPDEQPEKSTRSGSMAEDASESVEREKRERHQVVSTAAYYSVEEHDPDGYFYDET